MTDVFDVVLFGASGFTGRLTATYLAAAGGSARWAIAGRNREKLEAVARSIGAEVPILIGDVTDPESLRKMVEKAKVVCTTVGPYAKYGTPLVERCADAGVAYCDLTGEVHWIREMIDRFHRRAEQTGARIVHCAGFDSIPSDLGVFMLAEEMERRHGRKLGRVRCRVGPVRGGFSAGTLASIAGVLGAMKRPELRRVFADPYALNPEGAPRGPDENERLAPEKDEETGRWTAPFIMSSVNTRIVRRSNALLGQKYGESFSYQEAMNTGRGAGGLALAAAISAGVSTVSVAAVTLPDSWIERLLPKSGEGPSAEKQARGFFRLKLFAEGLTGTVEGKGDPGYSQTAKMLAESALCLALDPAAAKGGILTPAAAMGQALLERLRRAGMGFSVAVSGSAG